MAAEAGFRKQQRGVGIGMALAALATVGALLAAFYVGRSGGSPSFDDRLQAVLKMDLFVVLWLGAAIANVARMRFFSPQDIGGSSTGSASPAVRNARAILQNTLEQVVLAVPVHVALAAVFVTSVPLVLALTVLFAIGRILFWIGYPIGAAARSFGFALTFYPTMAGLIIAVLGLVMR